MQPDRDLSISEEDDEDLFFAPHHRRTQTTTEQLDQYLSAGRLAPQRHLSALDAWPQLKALFVEMNTPLPASAACERLFSAAGLIFTPRRACIGDSTFEDQLLLKLNKAFLD